MFGAGTWYVLVENYSSSDTPGQVDLTFDLRDALPAPPNDTCASVQAIALTNPNEQVFFHQTVLHRSPDEFQPMENYEVAISVSDSRGQQEIARGRIGLTGVVERHSGVVDFTGAAPVVR